MRVSQFNRNQGTIRFASSKEQVERHKPSSDPEAQTEYGVGAESSGCTGIFLDGQCAFEFHEVARNTLLPGDAWLFGEEDVISFIHRLGQASNLALGKHDGVGVAARVGFTGLHDHQHCVETGDELVERSLIIYGGVCGTGDILEWALDVCQEIVHLVIVRLERKSVKIPSNRECI